jgi:hypothetical protein
VQAPGTLRGHCKQKVIPIEHAKQELAVVEYIRPELRNMVRYLTDMRREEKNLVTTGPLEEIPMLDLTEDLE